MNLSRNVKHYFDKQCAMYQIWPQVYAVCDVSDLTSSICMNTVCSEINSANLYKTLNLKIFKNIMNFYQITVFFYSVR
jgi:hypothetical protein